MSRGALATLLPILLLFCLLPAAAGTKSLYPDRESSYPPQVLNITHDPWQPASGQDVAITMRLAPDVDAPDTATLLYCRVEPEYVCALPLFLTTPDNGHTWHGTIAWDEFMRPETRHVGYNITLRFADGSRVHAPLGNHWVPPTYPAESDGTYFFYRIDAAATHTTAAPGWTGALAALAALALAGGRRRAH